MPPRNRSLHLTILIILTSISPSLPEYLGLSGESFSSDPHPFGPFDVPIAKFHTFLSTPSATSTFPIVSPNLSLPYPGSPPPGTTTANWTWTVSVVADIPLSESNSTLFRGRNETFTANSVWLQAPLAPNGTAAVNPSWDICVFNWEVLMNEYPASWRHDDGSCSSIISEKCRKRFEASVARSFRDDQGGDHLCRCPEVEKLDACSAEEKAAWKVVSSCGAWTFNSTIINKWEGGRFSPRSYGSVPHARGHRTAYDFASSLTWPVMVMWVPSETGLSIPGAKGREGVPDSAARMLCVRAKEATDGSVVPGTVSSGDVRRSGTEGPLVILVIVVMLVTGWIID